MAEEADVYVVGSGPEDNARLLDKQGPLEAAGLRRAIEVGRGGKGVVVIVPPGNGGSRGDSCAFDGMVIFHASGSKVPYWTVCYSTAVNLTHMLGKLFLAISIDSRRHSVLSVPGATLFSGQ